MFSKAHGVLIIALLALIAFAGSAGAGSGISRIPISSIKSTAQGEVPYGDGTKGAYLAPGVANQVYTTGGPSANPAWANISSLFTAGTGISFSGTTNLTITNTGVTSVALSLPSIFTVSGSPVTTTGTLTGTLANQSANVVFAGPGSGGAAAPTFRALVAADIPGGVPALAAWSSSTTYATSAVVIGSDNNLYIAVAGSNLNHDPTADSGTNWALYFVKANLTLNVSTAGGARFGGLVTGTNPVWTFVKFAYIPPAVTLTLSFADGTYSFSAAQTLNHPCGANISIVGDTTTPASCVLSFSGAVNGIVVSSGCTLGNFDGFKVLGTASGLNGVLANTGATLICGTHVTSSTWQNGFNAANRAVLFATSCKADTCSIAGFIANIGATLGASSSQSTGNTGDGYLAQNGSIMKVDSSTSTGNTGWGYHAQSGNGFINAQSVTANTNTAGNYSPAINTVGNSNSYIFQ